MSLISQSLQLTAEVLIVLMVYLIFAMTLYLLPPRLPGRKTTPRNTTENTSRAYDMSRLGSLGAASPENKGPSYEEIAKVCLEMADKCGEPPLNEQG